MKIKLIHFVPPIFILIYRKIVPKKEKVGIWAGDFASWEEAQLNCSGYDSDIILEKCKNALLKVKNKEAVYERDSVLFDKIQYSWGLLAGLQKATIENNNELCVLDFGGSLGSTYYQNKVFLSGLKKLEWNIVEQVHFVDCGKQNFENEQLKFYHTIEECTQNSKPNVLLLSSVLQYLENPNQWIEKFNNLQIEYIIIDRTAFIDSDEDILTIQNVPESIYKASYPAWFFNKEKLIKKFKNYIFIAEINNSFTQDAIINNKKAEWTGMILKINK
ncbi:TIGR04325 family methyltransferase [Flavobacterium sp.]|uniref:TIGR04325 family methyltransferase n=1 Tax=Flavobacterium sp. TaxID=239 RepID=UPI0038FD12E6